jgi:hypothetical protein
MISICFEDQAQRMSELAGCSVDEAIEFLCSQTDYYDEIGLIAYPEDEDFNNPIVSSIVVEEDEMTEYLRFNTSLSEDVIEKLLEADTKYLIEVGIIDEEDFYE